MDNKTYEQSDLGSDFLGDNVYYLKEGETYEIVKFEGAPVSLQLPIAQVAMAWMAIL